MADSVKGQKDLQTGSSDFNAKEFQIRQALIELSTTKLVKVLAVGVTGLTMGTVDVQALVDQMDGNGQPQPHGIIYEVPYHRVQGGVNAVIIDPVVGDIGLCVFSDRDISRVKINKTNALPGSKRIMHMADALYIGGVLNAAPTRYIKFSDDGNGIEIVGVEAVSVFADEIEVTANTKATVTAPEVEVNATTKAVILSPLIEMGENPVQNVVLSGDLCPLGLSHVGTSLIKGTQG